MVTTGLVLGLVGSAMLMCVFGMPWVKWNRPMWHEKWSPLLQRSGGATLIAGFALQIAASLLN